MTTVRETLRSMDERLDKVERALDRAARDMLTWKRLGVALASMSAVFGAVASVGDRLWGA